jgi:hypothetical protein
VPATFGPILGGGVELVIGERGDGGYPLPGSEADLQIYSTSLSANQVQQLYAEGIDGPPLQGAGLAAWYPLDGNGNDYSGNGNNGAVTGISFPFMQNGYYEFTNEWQSLRGGGATVVAPSP